MSYARLEAEARRLNVEITCHKHGPKGAWIPHLKRVSIREDLIGGGGLLVHLLTSWGTLILDTRRGTHPAMS
ncbi:hypothetical protein HNR04_002557 [Corynebacterium durum]|nr:hypothetical protein [Corynebacterium durum]